MPADTYTANRDPKRCDQQVVVGDFRGMAPSQDSHDTDPALSAYQVNCHALHPGELRCRQGMKLVTFDGPSC